MGGHHHHTLSSSRGLLFTTLLIGGFAVIELIGGFWSHSLALISDAGHMFADTAALLLATFAAWIAKRPPSPKLSYGYGRVEVIGASLSSLLLIFIVIAIVVEALERFETPTQINGKTVAIIAFVGLVVNLIGIWILNHSEKNLNTRAAALHILSDALGSIAALLSGLVILFTHVMLADTIFSLLISLLILVASIRLLRETFSVLMEGVPYHLDITDIREAIMAKSNNVVAIHDLHVWTLSSRKIMLTAHLTINELLLWQHDLQRLQKMLANQFGIHHITLQPECYEFPLVPLTQTSETPIN